VREAFAREMGSARACVCVLGDRWWMDGEERRRCWEGRAYLRMGVFGMSGGVGNAKK